MELLIKNQGVMGTVTCKRCGGVMLVKANAEKRAISMLPCTASCTNCKAWFDCREPSEYVNRIQNLSQKGKK